MRISQDASARSLGAIEDIVNRGRASGFGIVLIGQRPANIATDVLTQVEVLITHQLVSPQDRKALSEWVQAHDSGNHQQEFFGSLASLKVGQAWVWSPRLDLFARGKVNMRTTFDSSNTPEYGERVEPPKALAQVDVEKIRAAMGDAVREIDANDPKKMRKQVAEMRAQVERLSAVEQPDVERIIADANSEALRGMKSLVAPIARSVNEVKIQHAAIAERLETIAAECASLETLMGTEKIVVNVPRKSIPMRVRDESGPKDFWGKLADRHKRVLNACAYWESIGQRSPSRAQVAIAAGYSHKSSGYEKTVSQLSSLGFVEYPSAGMVAASDLCFPAGLG
ncbi:MAG: DUF853 family protein [Phycisphaerales bacterium]|nr:DUF853 family protein [Phycisphaerales bacterium]